MSDAGPISARDRLTAFLCPRTPFPGFNLPHEDHASPAKAQDKAFSTQAFPVACHAGMHVMFRGSHGAAPALVFTAPSHQNVGIRLRRKNPRKPSDRRAFESLICPGRRPPGTTPSPPINRQTGCSDDLCEAHWGIPPLDSGAMSAECSAGSAVFQGRWREGTSSCPSSECPEVSTLHGDVHGTRTLQRTCRKTSLQTKGTGPWHPAVRNPRPRGFLRWTFETENVSIVFV